MTRPRPRRPRIQIEIVREKPGRPGAAAARAVRSLPWREPLERWPELGVEEVRVRRGAGRHQVRFVNAGGVKLVVKELGEEGARREAEVYRELRRRGIESLEPVAVVVREEPSRLTETPAGGQLEPVRIGHIVTRLAERVIPESLLVPLAFAPRNRRRIWDAELDLFVDLHAGGVYWGDASPANTLVRFDKEEIPYVGRRTRLRAVLADAETVEIRVALSPALREADLSHFLDALLWLNEDLRLAGLVPEPRITPGDLSWLRSEYRRRYALAMRDREFAERTGLDVRAMLGRVREPAYLDRLEQHVGEHKWYLSERAGREVPWPEAAADWYREVFVPICRLFQEEDIPELFPGRTASDLYVEVMTHKYFLSEAEGRDVGMAAAFRDYAGRFGRRPLVAAIWRRLAARMGKLVGRSEAILRGENTR